MPLTKLTILPGVDKQNSEYGAEGRWIDSDYVRFRYGLPEKIGGWSKFNDQYLIGACRALFSWNSLAGDPLMALGTSKKLYVNYGTNWTDITPIRATGTVTSFTAVLGSTILTVTDPAHGAIPGDFVTFSSTTSPPGGFSPSDIDKEFEITAVLDTDRYTLTMPYAATGGGTSGGATATYQINVGNANTEIGYGWGAGIWGGAPDRGWGEASSTGIILTASVWQFDSFGEDLIAQIVDGPTYYWDTSVGIASRATLLSGAPTKSRFALVSTPDRHLVLFGTESTIGTPSSQDPLFVRFSNQEDVNTWTESATNTAGGQRLTDGNKIITAIRSRGQILIYTDTSVHGMQYVGPPYTFSFQQLGVNCGCIGPHAAVDANGIAFWMSPSAFFIFDGTVKKMPCTVQDYVFGNLNQDQGLKVYAGHNADFNEITWFYVHGTEDPEINAMVTYNYLENTWHTGSLARTAWVDRGVYSFPVATSWSSTSTVTSTPAVQGVSPGRTTVYYHENGVNGDGAAIDAYIQSGYFDIGDGQDIMFMRRFIPDFRIQEGNIEIQLRLRAYPSDSATSSSLDPYLVTPTTDKVDTRARGRQLSFKVQSDEVDTNWRYGTLRVDIQPDGQR